MGLIYDNPDLAALTLTRLAAEESEGPGALEGRMPDCLRDLEQRNGTAYLELVAITLARVHFTSPWTTLPGRREQMPWNFSTPPKSRSWRASRCGQAYSVQVEITGTIQAPDGSYRDSAGHSTSHATAASRVSQDDLLVQGKCALGVSRGSRADSAAALGA
ncbi:hypothetical protein AHiyo6_31240 [Arthrobacter sp. Hiyo6]|nr:hypothetical protein AHiyo6_31240 [Arthrobacter sp. Hiyo6]